MTTRRTDITGVVLAGGRSRRMQHDKAMLRIDGRTQIERTCAALLMTCDEVIVSTGMRTAPLDVPRSVLQIPDRMHDRGPLGGVHAAMCAARTARVLVLPVDLPLIDAPALLAFLDAAGDAHAAVLMDHGRLHPCVGIYPTSAAPFIACMLADGRARMRTLAIELESRIVDASELQSCHAEALRTDIDTVDDLVHAMQLRRARVARP